MGGSRRASAPASLLEAVPSVLPQPRVLAPPHNLPIELSSFVGRKRELSDICAALASSRLLTLTGPGGIGKTRLALRAARGLFAEHPDGVWLVELAALPEPQFVVATIARTIGVRGEPGVLLLETLADALRQKAVLVVLDNCEHLGATCGEIVTELLRTCEHLRVLATSRERLGVEGEQVWIVPPLAASGEQELGATNYSNEAVQLFLERARANRPEFTLNDETAGVVAELCRRLDGLPLAIELAAAEMRALSPVELLNRLDQRLRQMVSPARLAAPRHRTLQATIDWSFDLLTETERTLFRRCGIFAGSWTLDSAEAVIADDELRRSDVLPSLLRLVDKSLAVAEMREAHETRYWLPETLRQDAIDRLSSTGELECMRRRHATHFLQLASSLEPTFARSDEGVGFDRLEAEHDNMRSALGWLITSGDNASARRLGTAMRRFWMHRSYFQQGQAWINRLLDLQQDGDFEVSHQLRHTAARIAEYQGDMSAAQAHGKAGLQLALKMGDSLGQSSFLCVLGDLAAHRGAYATARALHERGVAAAHIASKHPSDTHGEYPVGFDSLVLIQNLWRSALASCYAGNYGQARHKAEEASALASEAKYPRLVAQSLRVLACVQYRQGELANARSLLENSLRLWRDIDARPEHSAEAMVLLACVARDQRQFAEAHSLLANTVVALETQGLRIRVAQSLDVYAGLAAARGQPERAFRLAGAADRLYANLGCDSTRVYRFELQRCLEGARQGMAGANPTAARAEGASLRRSDAISEALSLDAQEPALSKPSKQKLLTSRELDVARLISRGATDREIAQALVISESTAHTHVRNILGKLCLQNRAQIAAWVVNSADSVAKDT